MKKENILLTIGARGGSKGVKNKNIRLLQGKPLIAHTILQAIAWGKADKIICSTDSAEIARIARESGAEVPFMRPDELSGDTTGKVEVLRHALLSAESIYKTRYSIIVDLDATAPVRKISDIDGALSLFLEKRPKTLLSATPARKNPYYNMLEITPAGFAVVSKSAGLFTRRQDAPKVFDANASLYVYDREFLADPNNKSVLTDRTLIWEMDEFSAVDIDSELDFQFIEFLVSKGLVKL